MLSAAVEAAELAELMNEYIHDACWFELDSKNYIISK